MPVITSFDAYRECLNSVFQMARPGAPDIEVTLIKADLHADTQTRLSFSLIFQGPAEVQPQQSYRLRHAVLEDIDVFLVPIQRVNAGIQYEAVFNLVKAADE